MRRITEIAADLGVQESHLLPYGHDKAKISLAAFDSPRTRPPGRLILVSGITPTAAGEGKTTTSIGLADAMRRRGASVVAALREPSLGPCLGMKGVGTGGGRCQLAPADSINLHFTGDFHAITSAHNLLSAVIDNHLHFASDVRLDERRIRWRRVLDMNDRALRDMVIGLGGPTHGIVRETGFDITAASEIMAILCLATDYADLRLRLGRIVVGHRADRSPVTAADLGCVGAMMVLLKDALQPNLVQTLEGTPALVHGGPFANIAHGCSSVIATRMALHHADWVITEAGFGFDLGAEKFFDIKCRSAGLDPALVVLVASVRALALHGAGDAKAGLPNLEKHIESIRHVKGTPVVALNRMDGDTDGDIASVGEFCAKLGVPFAVSDHYVHGGEGALALADAVLEHGAKSSEPFRPVYELTSSIPEKVRAVSQQIYGATDVAFTKRAERELRDLEKMGFGGLPVCIAKTHSSLSDDPKLHGRPRDFEITVSSLELAAGAGFVVVLCGDILRMPGLPMRPRAEELDLVDGQVVGLT